MADELLKVYHVEFTVAKETINDDMAKMAAFLEQKRRDESILFVYGSGKRKSNLQKLLEALYTYQGRQQGYDESKEIFGGRNSYAIHDNYPTYDLLKQWSIKPFIPLNNRSDNKLQPSGLSLSQNGIPICADGHEMTNWGFESKKYRIKYRCPLVVGSVKSCPYANDCNKSMYGKTVYVRLVSDLRLLTPVPRDTDEWSNINKQRAAAERVNNSILTDYALEQPKRYGKAKIAFFTFLNAINVHLDAQIQHNDISLASLIA